MARFTAIEIDFLRPVRGSRLGIWLLVAGVLAAFIATMEHEQVIARTQAVAEELDELRGLSRRSRHVMSAEESESSELRTQVFKANKVIDELNVPWGELFAAIEAAQNADIALLQVQPDARARVLRLGGAARNLPAVLDYMARLEQTDDLKDVLLVSHELKRRVPGSPVEFVLTASWMDAQ